MIFFLQDIVIMISFVAVSLQERLVWEPTKWEAVVKQGIKLFLYLEILINHFHQLLLSNLHSFRSNYLIFCKIWEIPFRILSTKSQFHFVILIKFLIERINALPLLLKSRGDLEWQSMANNKWNWKKRW